jgi:hypothetical protein
MNTQIIITIPSWVIWCLGAWFILLAIREGQNIFLDFMRYKTNKLKRELEE